MAEKQAEPYQHPSTKEGWSEKLYRYVNEMVSVSQINYNATDLGLRRLAIRG